VAHVERGHLHVLSRQLARICSGEYGKSSSASRC